MVEMTLIRPVNKGHGHSFWYQLPIDFSYTTLSLVTFALGRTHRFANTFRTDDRQLNATL